jgi:AcrR family transcriptional regulator
LLLTQQNNQYCLLFLNHKAFVTYKLFLFYKSISLPSLLVNLTRFVVYPTQQSKLSEISGKYGEGTMPKVDRRVVKTQLAIKKSFIELMSEKNFDDITIQDIADRANVNRSTVYLHYLDKYDLLDKMIEEHINELKQTSEWACQEEWVDAIQIFFEYFETHYLFFSTMLASKEATPSFRSMFLEYVMEGYKEELHKTKGKNEGLSEDILVKFAANAYVGVLESWLKDGMPSPPKSIAKELGKLLERIL